MHDVWAMLLATAALTVPVRSIRQAAPVAPAVPPAGFARWSASDGSWDEAVEQATAGATHRVRLGDAPYVVGRISIDAAVPSGLAVSFGPPMGGAMRPVIVDIAPDGTYRADLPEPGPYFVQLRSQGLMVPGQGHDLIVRSGRNPLDWPMAAGTLSIDVADWNRASKVTVTVSRHGAIQHGIVTHGVEIAPAEPLPLIIPGVPPGSYDVFARQAGPPPMTSDTAVAEISADSPEARLTLTLSGQYVRLRLVDQQQQPVRRAQVFTRDDPLVEIGPGVFSLDQARRGGPMSIRAPGLAPSCKVAPAAGSTEDMTVVLDAGRPVILRVLGVGAMAHPPSLIWAGLDCPVSDFEFRVRPGSSSDGTDFEMPHFPTADPRYVGIGAPEGGIPITVADGVAVLRLRP